jgi:hypothetical protein
MKRKATHKIKKKIATMQIKRKITMAMLIMKSKIEILEILTTMMLTMMTNQWKSNHLKLESSKMAKT